MIAKLFEVRETKGKGRGLFAKQFIPRGTVIYFECDECHNISREELMCFQKEKRDFYLKHAFVLENGRIALDCDEYKYANHSCNANILEAGDFDIVVKDINKGEEATYDYRNFYDDEMFYDDSGKIFECSCGEANCCKSLKCIHPPPKWLQDFWDARVSSAMGEINNVPQPLKNQLLEKHPGLSYLFSKTEKVVPLAK